MCFVKINSPQPVVEYLTKTLTEHLAKGERVLWLVPGGSSIAIAVAVSGRLDRSLLSGLAVTLTDERYGNVDHADANWRQLAEAGFALPGAVLLPVLTGANRATTVEHFAVTLRQELDRADFALGFFGIGADGHTAGILPGSPAVTATDLAAGYDAAELGAAPFQRLTMTPPAIRQLDEAVIYAVGEPKWSVLNQLAAQELPIEQQPAQILKSVPTVTIFNDHRGDTA